MADRYSNRYDRGRERRDDDREGGRYGYRERDRGFVDRASDEVMSWFGDDDAARRRRVDESSDRREDRYDWSDRDERSDYYGSSQRASGRYRPDYENDERNMYASRSQGRRSGEDDRWRESRDRFYNRGREIGTRSYERSDYGDTGYGQYGRSNRDEDRYRDESGEGRSFSGRTGEFSADWDYDARARASQSGYNAQGYGISQSEGRQRGESRWTVAGPHTGKSPKGYKRSEERIREDICERLMEDGEVDASDIDVKITGNEVTLEGFVSDWRMKRRAEEVIQHVSGVDDVLNNLRVKRPDMQSTQEQTRTMGSEIANTASPTGTTPTAAPSSQAQAGTSRQQNR
jgi:osmotically-inducible protein OsmY